MSIAVDQKWTKIGDVVGQPGKDSGNKFSAPGGGKVTYEGKEYDYVFDIDVEDGVVLKLPYNLDTDAWHAAQDFIHKHDLPQGYLDTIANFIIKNSDQSKATSISGGSVDPFTGIEATFSNCYVLITLICNDSIGGGAYNSESAGGSGHRFNGGGYSGDPFTGSGAYSTQNGSSVEAMDVDAVNTHFPQKEFLAFSQQPKFEAMIKKLKEFNQEVEEGDRLDEADLERLPQLCTSPDSASGDVPTLMRALGWPGKYSFPALDILRLAILNPKSSQMLLDEQIIDNLFSLLLMNTSPGALDNCKMLAIRTMANMFSTEKGNVSSVLNKHHQCIFISFFL